MMGWIRGLEPPKWLQHLDDGRRYGHMTTNLSECINSVLKGTRNLLNRRCDSGYIQVLHYPCAHALVYEMEFLPIPDEEMWPLMKDNVSVPTHSYDTTRTYKATLSTCFGNLDYFGFGVL
ncbi:hypothetical protein AHAS_Ahas03G0112800 [Arachis hypogaea]